MSTDWRKNVSNSMHWFSLVMVIIYLGIGVYVYFSKKLNLPDENIRLLFSIFFICYGIFRGVRWLQKNKERKYYNNDDYTSI